MRILIYGLNFEPELTGIGKYTGEMATWFALRGHEVRVVTAFPYYPEWQINKKYLSKQFRNELKGNLLVFRRPLYVPRQPTGLKRIAHLISFALLSLPTMIAQTFWKPHVVLMIEPTLACSPAALMVAKISGAISVLHVQDFEVDAAFNLNLLTSGFLKNAVISVERWIMSRFNIVSTISSGMLQTLARKGIGEDKAILFQNWVDIDQIFPIPFETASSVEVNNSYRRQLGFSKHDIVLLYSGNMGEKQGLDIVIDSANRLQSFKHLKFLMCGNGSARNRLMDSAKNLSNVFWIDLQPIERLNELLNCADIHLLPQQEGAADIVMPSKLTGIFASGIPVVATTTKGTALYHAVIDRGLAVEPGNTEQFCSAIVGLANNIELRQALGRAARRYAVENLSKDGILQKFETFLLSKLQSKNN